MEFNTSLVHLSVELVGNPNDNLLALMEAQLNPSQQKQVSSTTSPTIKVQDGKGLTQFNHMKMHTKIDVIHSATSSDALYPKTHKYPTCNKRLARLDALNRHKFGGEYVQELQSMKISADSIDSNQPTEDTNGVLIKVKLENLYDNTSADLVPQTETQIISKTDQYKCDQYDKMFNRKSHLQRHGIVCEKSFVEEFQQKNHLLKHCTNIFNNLSGETEKSNPHAGDELISVIESNINDTDYAIPISVRTWPCDQCNMKYTSESKLRQHYTVHRVRPHKCDKCDKRFVRFSHKNRHMLTVHTNELRFECEFCDKRFKRADQLVRHFKTHQGVLPFKCQQCGLRFATSEEKIVHFRSHTGAYRCDMCFERFDAFSELREHRQNIHLPSCVVRSEILVERHEWYACPVCQQHYNIVKLSDHLLKHVKVLPGVSDNVFNDGNAGQQLY